MSKITRRDFINGTLMAASASAMPFAGSSDAAMAALEPDYYPPARTGLRGSHPGSYEIAHARAWEKRTDWGATTELSEEYDLVVVGGGISGLSAAYFYRKEYGPDKKILILDNHDDFGGHAKRNEHTIDGQLRLGFGGSQTMEEPHGYSKRVQALIKDIGIDVDRFESAFDKKFFKKHGLGAATFFNKKAFGEDKVVMHPFCSYPQFMVGLMRPTLSVEEAAAQAPLSEKGKKQLLKALKSGLFLLDVPEDEMEDYSWSTSYWDYLKNDLGIDDPGVMKIARHSSSDNAGGGADILELGYAEYAGALGLDPVMAQKHALGKEAYEEYLKGLGGTYTDEEPYIHHFPDGNASITRGLVKKMIPKIGPGKNAEELVLSKFDYSELDKSSNAVRIRLNSTVVNVEHGGDPESADEVFVQYISGNQSYRVKGKNVVMACYNMVIPHIVPNLPAKQDAALRKLTKMPLGYTSIGLRNWRALKETGIGMAMCPGNIHQVMFMDFPVSIGGYEYTKTPDDPCVLCMVTCPTGTEGTPAIEQFKEARYRMLGMPFSDYEDEIREQLSAMLPKGSFDFDRDVESITLNRWAHGYSWGNPGKVGRKRFGRITIANSDAVDNSMAEVAMEQAARAVRELD